MKRVQRSVSKAGMSTLDGRGRGTECLSRRKSRRRLAMLWMMYFVLLGLQGKVGSGDGSTEDDSASTRSFIVSKHEPKFGDQFPVTI